MIERIISRYVNITMSLAHTIPLIVVPMSYSEKKMILVVAFSFSDLLL